MTENTLAEFWRLKLIKTDYGTFDELSFKWTETSSDPCFNDEVVEVHLSNDDIKRLVTALSDFLNKNGV